MMKAKVHFFRIRLRHTATILLSMIGILSCAASYGHAGHDHSHWISPTIHGLTVVSIFIVGAIALTMLLGRSIVLLAQYFSGSRDK